MLEVIFTIITPIELLAIAMLGLVLGGVYLPLTGTVYTKVPHFVTSEITGTAFLIVVLSSYGEDSPEAVAIVVGLWALWTVMTLFMGLGYWVHDWYKQHKLEQRWTHRLVKPIDKTSNGLILTGPSGLDYRAYPAVTCPVGELGTSGHTETA